mmetsp:Transcript_5310/g.7828  ORF Transcript_5310/g.7828 Transcript_5310/m.7828 type:complete len:184 (+) Transcript_5310:65-616(+)
MPIQDLFELLINRLSETRLLRLAEVRYLTSFIQALEARLEPAAAERQPTDDNVEEAERLFIEERGYLEDRRSRRTETRAGRPEHNTVRRPERPIVASAPERRNRRILRRRRARQAIQRARQQATDTRTNQASSTLTRTPDASQVEQAGNIVINQVADQISRDIASRAVAHAEDNVRTSNNSCH